MKSNYNQLYDSRFVTDDFLLTYFPSKNKFQEYMHPLKNPLESSKQLYIKTKKELNSKREKSGKKPWNDSDIVDFIRLIDGTAKLKRPR
jgi:hypothetical protein